jgi:hypothetical protein
MEMVLMNFDKYLRSILLSYPVPNSLNTSCSLLEKLKYIQTIEAEYHSKALNKAKELMSSKIGNFSNNDLNTKLLDTIEITFIKFKSGRLI